MPISEEELEKIVAAKQFELGATLPTGWKFRAKCLKWAADRIVGYINDATTREFARIIEDTQKLSRGERPGSGRGTSEETADIYDRQMIAVYLSLMGSAIEDLLKGILMAQHPEYLEQADGQWRLNPKKVKDHKLWDLFVRCGLPVESDEEEILGVLTEYVVWIGRYPVPLKQDDMLLKKGNFRNLIHSGLPTSVSQWHQKVSDLYDRLFGELIKATDTTASQPGEQVLA